MYPSAEDIVRIMYLQVLATYPIIELQYSTVVYLAWSAAQGKTVYFEPWDLKNSGGLGPPDPPLASKLGP